MKVLAAVALATFAVGSIEAKEQAHVRIHISDHSRHAVEWEQCYWNNKKVECLKGLQCTKENEWFGMCVKTTADLWGQCNGKGWPSQASCPKGSSCVRDNDWYSQCRPGNGNGNPGNKVPEWGQCLWKDRTEACADDLQCIKYNDWYGQCMKKEADLWGQCNGQGWPSEAKCKSGKCQKVNDWYWQCKPSRHHHHHREHAHQNKSGARQWEQCLWIDKQLPCDAGLMCIKHNDWYGQCMKKEVEMWGQCNGQGWPQQAKCKSGKCHKINDWYWQCK